MPLTLITRIQWVNVGEVAGETGPVGVSHAVGHSSNIEGVRTSLSPSPTVPRPPLPTAIFPVRPSPIDTSSPCPTVAARPPRRAAAGGVPRSATVGAGTVESDAALLRPGRTPWLRKWHGIVHAIAMGRHALTCGVSRAIRMMGPSTVFPSATSSTTLVSTSVVTCVGALRGGALVRARSNPLSPHPSLRAPIPRSPGSSCVAVKFVPTRTRATHGAHWFAGAVVDMINDTAVGNGDVDVPAKIAAKVISGTPTPPCQRLTFEAVGVGAEADVEQISATTTASFPVAVVLAVPPFLILFSSELRPFREAVDVAAKPERTATSATPTSSPMSLPIVATAIGHASPSPAGILLPSPSWILLGLLVPS